jgi:hypothetical protein
MFLQAEIAAFAGLGMVGPDPGGRLLVAERRHWSCGGETAPGRRVRGGEAFMPSALSIDRVRQGRQHRQTLTGPLVDT